MNHSKSLLVISTAISLVVGLGFSGNLNAKTLWLEEDDFKTVSQGDRDDLPTFFEAEEELAMKEAAKNPQKETVKDQEMPTLTAEGGFLLPTYVLPEAQGVAPEKVATVDNQNPWRKPPAKQAVPAQRNTRSGVAIRGVSPELPQSNGEKALLDNIEKQYQTTVALLEKTEKRLASLEKDIENYSKNRKKVEAEEEQFEEYECEEVVAEEDTKPRAPLLLPLAPIRTMETAKVSDDEDNEEPNDIMMSQAKKDYVDYILEAIDRSKARKFNPSQSDEMILRSIPKEMRISFLPGSADLSSQAFKWVKVFSYNPQRTVGSAVEVRLSPRDLDLQSRRFALIKGALLSNGLTPRQIRFVFTDRDCDSVVLRNIQLPETQEFLYQTGKNGKISQQIIQKW